MDKSTFCPQCGKDLPERYDLAPLGEECQKFGNLFVPYDTFGGEYSPADVPVAALFDLKGSKTNRTAGGPVTTSARLSRKKVYKDLDFAQVMHAVPLADSDNFRLQLACDVALLEWLKVMDYSLLLAFTESPATGGQRELQSADGRWRIYVGVIDYLQRFNSRKKLEVLSYRIKRPQSDPLDRSCVNPRLYADRFLHYITRVLP